MQQNIYIVGMPGSGKSTWGKRLAKAIQYSFVDLDKLIEKNEGISVAEIFSIKGEEYFREIEQKTLHETIHLSKTVIACGGGTPCFFDNMQWINMHGKSIYFKANAALLFDRMNASKTPRPLFLGIKSDDLLSHIEKILHERGLYYLQSNITIELPFNSVQSLVSKVI
ncbi:MAG: shikimate kinase [Bacteroidetes bacterium]|nr:shikimate kinase [Bacteroidota bacterium]